MPHFPKQEPTPQRPPPRPADKRRTIDVRGPRYDLTRYEPDVDDVIKTMFGTNVTRDDVTGITTLVPNRAGQ